MKSHNHDKRMADVYSQTFQRESNASAQEHHERLQAILAGFIGMHAA